MQDRDANHCSNTPTDRRAMLAGVAGLAAGAFLTSRAGAGDLNPPPGPISPTMKPLDQIEPRIAINSANTPGVINGTFRISQPGSYYLAGNITGESGKTGILVDADNITIDLMGFTLQGVSGSLAGIRLQSNHNNVTIRNGVIDGWGGNAIDMTGLGVGTGGIVDGVHASNCLQTGIRANARSTVRNCFAIKNQGGGISAATGSRVENCVAHENADRGIQVNPEGCVIDCTATANGNHGIDAQPGLVARCVAASNDGFGIHTASRGGSVLDNVCRSNILGGVRVFGDVLVRGNACMSNGPTVDGTGIFVANTGNTIEDNSLSGNGIGMWLGNSAGSNLVIRNRCRFNGLNWLNQGNGNRMHVVSALASSTFSGNAGGNPLGTDHPFANFTF